MARKTKRRRLSEVLPRDIGDVAQRAIELCSDHFQGREQGGCVQGTIYFKRAVLRKFEGMISNFDDLKAVERTADRLCFMSKYPPALRQACRYGVRFSGSAVAERLE